MNVDELRRELAGFGEVAWRKTLEEPFFSTKEMQLQAFDRRSSLREKSFVNLEGG